MGTQGDGGSGFCAGKAGCVVGASCAFVLCDLGVGAEGTGAVGLGGWSVCGEVEGEDRAGSLVVFDPGGEGCVEIECVRAVTAVAVPHTGGQVEAHGGGCRRTSGLEDGVVVVDGVLRCDEAVGETVVEDELAAVGEEGLEVGVGCGESSVVDLLGDGYVGVEVEGAGVPFGVFEDDVFEVGGGDGKRWRGEGVPRDLTAGLEAGEDLFVGAGVDGARRRSCVRRRPARGRDRRRRRCLCIG